MRDWIQSKLKIACKKADSVDPFEIARQRHILICYEELGNIRGYYNIASRQQFIHINQELPEHECRFTCAHELGHAILHPRSNTPFLRENTLFSINKLEREANLFAAYLLCPDDLLEEAKIYGYTTGQIAAISGVPEEMIRWRTGLI